MSELTVRGDRALAAPTFQAVAKLEKQSGSAPAQKTAEQGTVSISDTLRELMARIGQPEGQLRGSRNILQTGQAVLDEVKDSLDRIAELAQKAAEGEEPDREALQAELEKLVENIDRMLNGTVVDGKPLFAQGEAELVEGILSGEIDLDEVLQAVQQLVEKLAEGLPAEEVLGTLDISSPLMSLLTGLGGMDLDMLMSLLSAMDSAQTAQTAQPSQTAPEQSGMAETASDTSDAPAAAGTAETAETAGTAKAAELPARAAPGTVRFGSLQVTGRDLSGVSFDKSTGEVTIAGKSDVTVQGTEQGEQPSVRLTGSGQVVLRDVKAPLLTVDSPQARVATEGENRLGEVRLTKDAALILEGGGLVRLSDLRGDSSNLLRLTGGALIQDGGEGKETRDWKVPVVVEGPALLMAQGAVVVRDGGGKALDPFDLVWKTLLPGWSTLTSLEEEGKQAKQALHSGDLARLWLDKGDPTHGFTIHTLFLQGRDEAGRLRSRYAYLRWDQQRKRFREAVLYPNPFRVTGGEAGEDWVYEEESQTLHILSGQVTAIAGGTGTDANQEPFSGRLALKDHIGLLALVLEGVECRVAEGPAFDLGRDNDVTLILASGSSNRFESGEGWPDISMGEDTRLSVGYAEGPAGTLNATIGSAPEQEEGISLQVGGGSVTLPRFPLSSKVLRLDMLRVSTQEYAQAAMTIVDADRRWVAQIQSVYRTLHSQLERSMGAFPGGQLGTAADSAVRDMTSAGALVEDVKRTILLHPEIAAYTHSRRGREDFRRLLR